MPSALVLLMAFILAIDINHYFDAAKNRTGWKLSLQKELPESAYSLPLAV